MKNYHTERYIQMYYLILPNDGMCVYIIIVYMYCLLV